MFKKSLKLIPVRDVKQHLVEEFKRSNQLEVIIKEKENRIEFLEKKEDELNKAYIILEQFKFRHGKQQEEIESLKDKNKKLKEDMKKQKEETNNSIIRMMSLNKEIENQKKEIAKLKRQNTILSKNKKR